MSATPALGAPSIDWDVAVERANQTQCTYWITVKNLTSQTLTFEGRFAVLS
jgi:glycyl-tRNA synthetase alpha subunit